METVHWLLLARIIGFIAIVDYFFISSNWCRLLFLVALYSFLAPGLTPPHDLSKFSFDNGYLALVGNLSVGLLIGVVFSLGAYSLRIALGVSEDLTRQPAVKTLLSLSMTVMLFELGLGVKLLTTFTSSLTAIPLSQSAVVPGWQQLLLDVGGTAFVSGVVISLPLLLGMIVVDLGSVLVTRYAPVVAKGLRVEGVRTVVALSVVFLSYVFILAQSGQLFVSSTDAAVGKLTATGVNP